MLPLNVRIPKLIAIPGTWQAQPGEVAKAVQHALASGYRHLDCALIYRNGTRSFNVLPLNDVLTQIIEKEVGDAIKASGVPRNEIFITSKL